MRQISTRICVSREHFDKAIFSPMENTATPFNQSMPVCVKQIMARKTSSAVICDSKYRLRSFGRKIVK